MRKNERTQTLNFFLVLKCLPVGLHLVYCPTWNAPHQKKVGLVNFLLLTYSWLVFNCTSLPYHVSPLTLFKKTRVFHSLPLVDQGTETFVSAGFTHAYKIFRPPVFPSLFQLPRVLWPGCSETVWFIYLFIYSISTLFEPFNYVTLFFYKDNLGIK